jgi:hypothetical protein
MKKNLISNLKVFSILTGCFFTLSTIADALDTCPDPSLITLDARNMPIAPEGSRLVNWDFKAKFTNYSAVSLDSIGFESPWGAKEGPYDVVVPKREGILCYYSIGLTPTGSESAANAFVLSINETGERYLKLDGPWHSVNETSWFGFSPRWSYSCYFEDGECTFTRIRS